ILEQFEMDSARVDSADSLHLQIEALKLAFADAHAYVADIDHMPLRPEKLLDREYLKHRAALIDPKRAKPAFAGTPSGGTVYLTAADESPWKWWRLQTLESRMESCRRNSHRRASRRVAATA